jgi:hypothetical protein
MNRKFPCGVKTVSDAAYVDRAVTWSKELTRMKSRGPGDMENAMRNIEREYGIDYTVQWALRYRKPKDILAGWYFKLKAAYEAECSRQMRKLQHEIEITKAIAGADSDAVVSAQAFVRENLAEKK